MKAIQIIKPFRNEGSGDIEKPVGTGRVSQKTSLLGF